MANEEEEKLIYLEVDIKRIYCFKEGEINGWTTEKVVDEWFANYHIDCHHASREAYHLGGADRVFSVKKVLPEVFKYNIEWYNKMINNNQKRKEFHDSVTEFDCKFFAEE
jgi:hypothetical protein